MSGKAGQRSCDVHRLIHWMKGADRILVISGAGMSADSGLPTYRGVGGIYDNAGTEDGIPIERALSGEMLRVRPDICWKYIAQIERACRGAQPNEGHLALATLERSGREVWVLTQNVDGLHQEAGSRRVIPIHGDVHELQCTSCAYGVRVSDYSALQIPPRCPECGHLVRPRVVLFGEMLPYGAMHQLQTQLELGFDMVLSIGTTSVFPYIQAPVVQAASLGARSVEINMSDTEVSGCVDMCIRQRASTVLQELICGLGLS